MLHLFCVIVTKVSSEFLTHLQKSKYDKLTFESLTYVT